MHTAFAQAIVATYKVYVGTRVDIKKMTESKLSANEATFVAAVARMFLLNPNNTYVREKFLAIGCGDDEQFDVIGLHTIANAVANPAPTSGLVADL
jgi:hypothetical protein